MTRIAAGIVVLAVVVIGAIVLLGGNDDRYLVRAEMADADGVGKHFLVRADGLRIGEVTHVSVTRRDTAIVTIALDKGAPRIGAGATLAARPANLLGEKYLSLTTGDAKRPLARNSLIALKDTSTEVGLDEVLDMLDQPTRASLRILINEAGIGLAGRGADFNALLGQLPPTLSEVRSVASALAADNRRLGDLIDQSETVLDPLDQHRDDVVALVGDAQHLLTRTALRRAQLARTIQAAPPALRQIQTSLGHVTTTAQRLEPAAALLQQATPSLNATLTELPGFVDAAHGTLQTATSVAPALEQLGTQGTPLLARLRPTSARLATFAKALAPVSQQLGRGGIAAGILDVMNGWASAINHKDGLGHSFRLRAVVTPSLLTGLVERLTPQATAKGKKTTKPDLAKTVRDTTDRVTKNTQDGVRKTTQGVQKTLDDTRKVLNQTTGAVGGVVKGLLQPPAGKQPDPKAQTGLLDFLLGK